MMQQQKSDATKNVVAIPNDVVNEVRGERFSEPRWETNWVKVEDVVEEDAYSNEVGRGNTFAGDVELGMVEEGENEMNNEEEDVDLGIVHSDGDVVEDEVAQANVSNRVDIEFRGFLW
ncbi:hypothetical protein V6N13_124440 [Hibiscus sabdariffa]